MNAIGKYLLFILFLAALVGMAVHADFPRAGRSSQTALARNPAGDIPSPAIAPSHVLTGSESTGAIDYRVQDHLTATGEVGRIRLWQLPEEQPVAEIDAGEGFQVLQVGFVPGSEFVAGCGQTPDGLGSIRFFSTVTGKAGLRIDDPEPVYSIDFDRSGRYLVFTALSTVKVWDLVDKQAVSVFPRNNAGARGLFFQEDRFILQSDTLSLYDWKSRKSAGGLEEPSAVDRNLKKVNENLSAWMTGGGLHILRSPYGRREFIPLPTQGLYAFDLAPDGRWALFLQENKTMSQVDCATGLTVKTIALKSRPEAVFIAHDGSSAYVFYAAGKTEVFDIGNENLLRNFKYYTVRTFKQLWSRLRPAEGA